MVQIIHGYSMCPIVEEFHIRNVLGSCERRQLMFGSRVTITSGSSKALTLSGLSGGLITQVDHFQVLAQKLNVVPSNKTYVNSKTTLGFTLYGDNGAEYSVVILATLPTHPRATPKWAWDYCPECKNLKFKAITGSIVRDAVAFSGLAYTDDGSTPITFEDMTATSGSKYGHDNGVKARGTQRQSWVTMMEDEDYQIIITKSNEAGGAVTVPPYPSALK